MTKTSSELKREARAARKAKPQAFKPSLSTQREGLINEIGQAFALNKRLERAADVASARIAELEIALKDVTDTALEAMTDENRKRAELAFVELADLRRSTAKMEEGAKEAELLRLRKVAELSMIEGLLDGLRSSNSATVISAKMGRAIKRVNPGSLGRDLIAKLTEETKGLEEPYASLAERLAKRLAIETESLMLAQSNGDKAGIASAKSALSVLENQRQSFDAIKSLRFAELLQEGLKEWSQLILRSTAKALIEAGLDQVS